MATIRKLWQERSRNYWQDREKLQRELYMKEEAQQQKEIERIYQDMYRWAEDEINRFYGKYADAEGIDITEAKKRVTQAEIEEYERLAKQYVKDKDFSPRANAEMRLYNATMKINRLEMLKARIGLHLVDGINTLDEYYEKEITDRTRDEIERQAGILGETVSVADTTKRADNIVNASFFNATYSERIWSHQDRLRSMISIELQKGLIAGVGSREMARRIKREFDVSMSDAHRLMVTELRRIQTDVAMDSYKRSGVERYVYMAVNPRACPICKALNGKDFTVEGAEIANEEHPLPPMHPNCHCTTAPYVDEDEYNAWLNYLEQGGSTSDWNNLTDAEKRAWLDKPTQARQEPPKAQAGPIKKEAPLDSYEELTIDEFKKLKNKVSKEERSIIYGKGRHDGYINSSNARVEINAPLREGKPLQGVYKQIADTLQGVIDRNKLPANIKMVRYVDTDALTGMFGIKIPPVSLKDTQEEAYAKSVRALADRERSTYTEKGFLSASAVRDNNVMTRKPVEINLYADEGTPAYITTNNKESEIIFGHNTQVELLDIRLDRSRIPWQYVADCRLRYD